MTHINRNPFARATLMRRKTEYSGTCKWCGQKGRFDYGWEEDQRPGEIRFEGPFCGVDDYRTDTDQDR